jgi:DNA-binding NtrC family response regulator
MSKQISLLIVDDEESVRDSLYNWFIEDGYHVECAEDAKTALAMLENKHFDIILTDIKMPGMDGMEMHRRIKALNTKSVVIIMTAFATVDTAVQALKDGAFDYVTKPFDPDELTHLIKNAAKQILLEAENEALKEKFVDLENVDDIIGDSEPMKKVLREVMSVAQSNSSVVITGESGTGKGAYCPGHTLQFTPKVFPACKCALWRLVRKLARKRTLWARKRSIHRGHVQPQGPF